MTDQERIQLAVSCRDCESVPKVADAGEVINSPGGAYQLMHNGVKAFVDSHYGDYNTEVIRRLRGHHEPQEEKVFHEVLQQLGSGSRILEVGSFWAYYSLWFLNTIEQSRAYLVEPLESALEAGRRNFALNGVEGEFLRAAIADQPAKPGKVELWPGMETIVKKVSIDSLFDELGLEHLEVLHADIQGAEVQLLKGAERCLGQHEIDWIFISTHGENIHQKCLRILRTKRYSVVAEHSPSESFSVDGLIVATAVPNQAKVSLSKNFSIRSVFVRIRATLRVRILEPLGLKPETS